VSLLLIEQGCVGKQLAFHKSQADSRWIIAGNRAGKTEAGAREAAFFLTGLHPYRRGQIRRPNVGWVITVDRQTALTVLLPKLLKFLPPELVRKVNRGDIPSVHMEDGSEVYFRSFGQGWQAFQSAAIDWAWFDEECPQDVYGEVMVRLIDHQGPHWATMTPLMGKTWVFREIEKGAAASGGDTEIFRWRTQENTTLSAQRIEKTMARVPAHLRAARESGEFVDMEGLVWPQFHEPTHMVDEFELPRHWPIVNAIDPGYDHPFAAVLGAKDDDGGLVIWKSYKRAGALVSQHAKALMDIYREHAPWAIDEAWASHSFSLASHGSQDHTDRGRPTLHGRWVHDPSGLQVAREFYPYGIFCSPAQRDMDSGLERVGELFLDRVNGRPGVRIMRGRNGPLLDELRSYSWAKKPRNREIGKAVPQDYNDDCCDAFRYLCMEHLPAASQEPNILEHSFEWHQQKREEARYLKGLMGNEHVSEREIHAQLVMGRVW
jgi:phage terminase large subunit-like protein